MADRNIVSAAFGAVAFASAFFAAPAAFADMGRAPVESGTYGGIEGGYLHQDGGDLIGHGVNTAPGVIVDTALSPDGGWFAGGMIGFASRDALIGGLPFHRVEVYGLYGRSEDDVSHAVPGVVGVALKNVDASVLVELGASGTSEAERRTFEGGLRFEADDASNATSSLTWVFNPFIRSSNEEINSHVIECCNLFRSGDVDTLMYGVVLAVEPELWLSSSIALVGRAGIGVYGYEADGDYSSIDDLNGFFAATLSDSESGIGFRGQLGAGLKFKLGSTANLETFAEADYFSDVGTARMANNQPPGGAGAERVSQTDTTDMWELRAGARLTVGFGSQ